MPYKVIFWSSVDPSAVLGDTIVAMRSRGVDAEIKFLISSEVYRSANTFFAKIILRVLMYLAYPIYVVCFLLNNKQNVINVVTSNTFYAPFLAIFFSGSNHKCINLIWDLYPSALGLKFNSKFPTNLMASVASFFVYSSLKRSSANIFIGEALLQSANREFGALLNSKIIPIGASSSQFKAHPPAFIPHGSQINMLYCGNLGVLHDVDTLIDLLASDAIVEGFCNQLSISFNASGLRYALFIERIRSINNLFTRNCLSLEGALSESDWVARMRESHVAIVTMSVGSEHSVLPSKTYSAISAGQAILAICPIKSDLALLVERIDCGWVVEPGDVIGLSSAFSEILNDRELLLQKRVNSFLAGHGQYSAESIADSWINLIHEVSAR